MINTTPPKILIFDAIQNIPLGREIHDALPCPNIYINANKLKQTSFYHIKRSIKKIYCSFKGNTKYFCHPKASASMTKTLVHHKPNIVLVIGFFYPYIDRDQLLLLQKKLNFKLFLLDTDTANRMESYQKLIHFVQHDLSAYDHIFSFSKGIMNFLCNLGIKNVDFFPYGAKVIPAENKTETNDIIFIGNPDIRRVACLESIKQHNITIYGRRCGRYKPLVSAELWQKIQTKDIWGTPLYDLLRQYKIVVNINTGVWCSLETGVNLRVFEALSLKRFLLTEYCEELHDLFEVGKEIETFRNQKELNEKIIYYLQHDDERQKIAERGYQKFLTCYTWEKRSQSLINRIKELL